MVHRGEIVEKAIRNSDVSITRLAKRLGKSRRHIYNIFSNPNVSWETIIDIGKIIHYDFGRDFSEFYRVKEYQGSSNKLNIHDSQSDYDANWKEKYFELLEKYNKLLAKYVEVIEKGK